MTGDVYLIVVFGGFIAVAVIVPTLVLRLRPLCSVVLPELVLFGGHKDRTRAFRKARIGVHADTWLIVLLVGMQMGLFMLTRRSPWVGSISLILFAAVFLLVPYLTSFAVFYWLFRGRLRRSLRQQLAERGHMICAQCMYDLRGQDDPRCPECGRAMEAAQVKALKNAESPR